MRSLQSPSGAFTLIELLIVVAIIAILALIAVPNFLEAQTRAKVSRVRADMRSLATAQEAYMTDWNSYTTADRARPNGRLEGWAQLTTPTPYITSIPRDVFGICKYPNLSNWTGPALFELGTGVPGVGPSKRLWDPGPGLPSCSWEMNSCGPDKREDTNSPSNTGGQYGWADASFPWVNRNHNDPAVVAEFLGMIYDPTNGTVSKGEIFRAGGIKPPGQTFDILYSVGSFK